MTNITKIPRKEKRQASQRLLWIAPTEPVLHTPTIMVKERRLDRDGANAAIELARMIQSGKSVGLIFGVLNADGKIELGCSGTLYDNPLIASGLAADLRALIDGWRAHPANFIPADDSDQIT